MKLELKHLAPYLPYALGFIHQDEIYQLMQLNIKYDQKPMWIEGWNGKNLINVFPEGCQPILRPLSELDVDGEVNTPEELSKCCWSYTQSLIAEHYDVFGLIPKGLAIDINTLK